MSIGALALITDMPSSHGFFLPSVVRMTAFLSFLTAASRSDRNDNSLQLPKPAFDLKLKGIRAVQ
ncbi:MAG TPA: hypothetical protein VKX41_04100 [Alloacidobacterium sp.]|nr:hypothetical protein [Alloacidobacterium sp.]